MSHKLLSHHHGIRTWVGYDADTATTIVTNTADIQGLVDRNTALQNDQDLTRGKDSRHVASIPVHVLAELEKMWKAQDIDPRTGMKKFLNDPDMRVFRTGLGRV